MPVCVVSTPAQCLCVSCRRQHNACMCRVDASTMPVCAVSSPVQCLYVSCRRQYNACVCRVVASTMPVCAVSSPVQFLHVPCRRQYNECMCRVVASTIPGDDKTNGNYHRHQPSPKKLFGRWLGTAVSKYIDYCQ